MKVIALSNIKHDQVVYEKGQEIEMSEEQAADLVVAGVVEATVSEEAKVEAKAKNSKKVKEQAPEEALKGVNPTDKWAKTRLLGYAKEKGIEVDETLTREKILKVILKAEKSK